MYRPTHLVLLTLFVGEQRDVAAVHLTPSRAVVEDDRLLVAVHAPPAQRLQDIRDVYLPMRGHLLSQQHNTVMPSTCNFARLVLK